MSFAITRRISPPPPYDNQVSNALNLNIFAITALMISTSEDKIQKYGNIKFQCSALEMFLLDVPHENCYSTEKRSQIGTNKCKGHKYFLKN